MSILGKLIQEKKQKEQLSDREIGRAVGVSGMTVSRAIGGESVDVDTLIRFCNWLGVSPSVVLDAYQENDVANAITAILEVEPQLAEVLKRTINGVNEGRLPPDAVRDIVRFILFRLQENHEPSSNRPSNG